MAVQEILYGIYVKKMRKGKGACAVFRIFVCVCVWERQGERERETRGEREREQETAYFEITCVLSSCLSFVDMLWNAFSKIAPVMNYFTGLLKRLKKFNSLVLYKNNKNSPVYLRCRTTDIDYNAYVEKSYIGMLDLARRVICSCNQRM